MNAINRSIPIVTVAVCTFNRAAILARCIECLVKQDVSPEVFAILIIDNGSTDDTQSTVEKLISKHNNITYCYEAQPGLSNARNRALKESVSAYTAFIDDDGFAPAHWVSCIVKIIDSHAPLIMGGPIRPHHDIKPPSWYPHDIEYSCKHIPHGWVKAPCIFGGNFVVHRATALNYGGLDPDLGMIHGHQKYHEETALAYMFLQNGHRIYFSHEAWVGHLVNPNRYSYFYHGYTNFLKGKSANDIKSSQYAQQQHLSPQLAKRMLRYQLHHQLYNNNSINHRNKATNENASIKHHAIGEQRNIARHMWELGQLLEKIKKCLP